MKYLSAGMLLLLALSGCAEHHELTSCKGPYMAMIPPPPPPSVETPKLSPKPVAAMATKPVIAQQNVGG